MLMCSFHDFSLQSFCNLYDIQFFFRIESPKSYISEDAGSPCSVDPNAMDVDSVGSPPTMVNLPCKLTRSQRGNIV